MFVIRFLKFSKFNQKVFENNKVVREKNIPDSDSLILLS